MSKYTDEVRKIMADSSASFWLKDAIARLENRDVLDALDDASCLRDLFELKWKEAIGEAACEDCSWTWTNTKADLVHGCDTCCKAHNVEAEAA